VIDRFIQQVIAQVLNDSFDSNFSQYSYGFRPNKRGHDAVRRAKTYIAQGYHWVVDIDLLGFSDINLGPNSAV
jgi:RNA-directed DNA polymerase